MNELIIVMVVSWLAGIAAFVGGLGAKYEGSANTVQKRELIHGVVAFGGGILTAAIALALIPEATLVLPTTGLAATFCIGGLVFCVLDAYMSRHGGSKAQFMAMLMDFIPEAVALGALFGHNHQAGILLALFIGLQNLPEGFNSFREICTSGVSSRSALWGLFGISFLGPVAALSGHLWLQNQPMLTAAIMSFAAGGILYLLFQDIAPQSKMRKHWLPPLGAVLGFAVGMIGKQLLG
ncbi:divalent cation transporter [Amphritea atlantica]|uniref:Divalent cation transporter n=1 Tax=Amphritea atlantica TaxID=355243 RepID=A0ABY5GZ74_9GAMM|nr:divalent cation transporter [Amphritea atlantica]